MSPVLDLQPASRHAEPAYQQIMNMHEAPKAGFLVAGIATTVQSLDVAHTSEIEDAAQYSMDL